MDRGPPTTVGAGRLAAFRTAACGRPAAAGHPPLVRRYARPAGWLTAPHRRGWV